MILCCGEALIDMLPRQTSAGEPAFAPFPGGAVFNTAVALGRLGADVEFFSGLSTDLFGDLLRRTLTESRVGTGYAAVSHRPTTLAFVRLAGGQASYVFYDENSAGRMLTASELPGLGAEVTALFFGGISLAVEPCGSAYEALLAREHAGRVTMLDPNIRRNFITDASTYRARLDRMIAMTDILRFSDEDLAWFDPAHGVEHAAQWLEHGPKLVLVTRGGAGAVAFMAGRRVEVSVSPVAVVDTVGAGDTFNAGVLAGLAERNLLSEDRLQYLGEEDLAAVLRFAMRAAAVTVARAGANPPWRNELPPS